jgi:hypothetical protein
MKTLEECAIPWTTDKGKIGHHYLDHYERYASRMRDSATKVLEIGIELGKSHRMWRDYFPNAHVIGLDSDPQHVVDLGERIEPILGYQDDPKMLAFLAQKGPYDLIVDDGSHVPMHQIMSFEHLFPSVKPGGVYIIEDIALHGPGGNEPPATWQYMLNLSMQIQGRGWIIAQYAWDEWPRLDAWAKMVEFVHIYRWCVVVGRAALRS